MKRISGYCLAALLLWTGAAVSGELGFPKKTLRAAVRWTVKNAPLTGARGETVKLELHAEVPNGYYTYTAREYPAGGPISAPPTFEFEPQKVVSLGGAITYSQPKIKKTAGGEVEVFEKEGTFYLPLKIAIDAPVGEQNLKVLIDSQVCDEANCIPSMGVPVAFALKVSDAPPKLETSAQAAPPVIPGKPAIAWSVKNPPVTGARGAIVKVELLGYIPKTYHGYPSRNQGPGTYPTKIVSGSEDYIKVDGAIIDPPTKVMDSFGDKVDGLEGEVVFTVPVRIATNAAPGEHSVKFVIDSQVCDDSKCVESAGVEVPFALKISDAPAVAAADSSSAKSETPSVTTSQASDTLGGADDVARARKEGLWSFIKLSIGAGFFALLTPCVFPMIPITVSFFTKRKQATRADAIRDAAVYAVGIISAFVVLGLAFTLILGASGVRDLSTNPIANIIVAVVFVALAFSLFGAFEIQVPTSIMNALNKKANEGEGSLSVLLMGIVFALTSFTCTVPFIGTVLVYATQGEYFWAILGTAGFATAFALPFIFLAVFPALLKKLPKSGGWMNSVKVVMGFIELAAALKFISNVDIAYQWGIVTREAFLAGWVALSLMIVFYLMGKFQMTHDSPVEKIGAARATLATGFLGIAVWLTIGIFGMKMGELDAFIPPRIYPGDKEPTFAFGGGGGGSKKEELTWIEDYDEAVALAKKTNTPLFLDFTGDQCVNCRKMEETVFPLPEIHALLKQYIRVKLITDRKNTPENRARSARYVKMQEERFGGVSLPYYVILSPNDEVLAKFDGFSRDIPAYEAFLKKGLEPKKAAATWYESIEQARAAAVLEQKPLFVYFTEIQMTTGRYMEEVVFVKPEVSALMENFIKVRLIVDHMYPPEAKAQSLKNTKYQEETFGSISTPLSVILSPDNELLSQFDGLSRDIPAYEAFLKKGLAGKEASATAAK